MVDFASTRLGSLWSRAKEKVVDYFSGTTNDKPVEEGGKPEGGKGKVSTKKETAPAKGSTPHNKETSPIKGSVFMQNVAKGTALVKEAVIDPIVGNIDAAMNVPGMSIAKEVDPEIAVVDKLNQVSFIGNKLLNHNGMRNTRLVKREKNEAGNQVSTLLGKDDSGQDVQVRCTTDENGNLVCKLVNFKDEFGQDAWLYENYEKNQKDNKNATITSKEVGSGEYRAYCELRYDDEGNVIKLGTNVFKNLDGSAAQPTIMTFTPNGKAVNPNEARASEVLIASAERNNSYNEAGQLASSATTITNGTGQKVEDRNTKYVYTSASGTLVQTDQTVIDYNENETPYQRSTVVSYFDESSSRLASQEITYSVSLDNDDGSSDWVSSSASVTYNYRDDGTLLSQVTDGQDIYGRHVDQILNFDSEGRTVSAHISYDDGNIVEDYEGENVLNRVRGSLPDTRVVYEDGVLVYRQENHFDDNGVLARTIVKDRNGAVISEGDFTGLTKPGEDIVVVSPRLDSQVVAVVKALKEVEGGTDYLRGLVQVSEVEGQKVYSVELPGARIISAAVAQKLINEFSNEHPELVNSVDKMITSTVVKNTIEKFGLENIVREYITKQDVPVVNTASIGGQILPKGLIVQDGLVEMPQGVEADAVPSQLVVTGNDVNPTENVPIAEINPDGVSQNVSQDAVAAAQSVTPTESTGVTFRDIFGVDDVNQFIPDNRPVLTNYTVTEDELRQKMKKGGVEYSAGSPEVAILEILYDEYGREVKALTGVETVPEEIAGIPIPAQNIAPEVQRVLDVSFALTGNLSQKYNLNQESKARKVIVYGDEIIPVSDVEPENPPIAIAGQIAQSNVPSNFRRQRRSLSGGKVEGSRSKTGIRGNKLTGIEVRDLAGLTASEIQELIQNGEIPEGYAAVIQFAVAEHAPVGTQTVSEGLYSFNIEGVTQDGDGNTYYILTNNITGNDIAAQQGNRLAVSAPVVAAAATNITLMSLGTNKNGPLMFDPENNTGIYNTERIAATNDRDNRGGNDEEGNDQDKTPHKTESNRIAAEIDSSIRPDYPDLFT